MKSQGFVAYDLCGLQYRPLDHALAQVDLAFCREDGPFRRHHAYASASQRVQQDRRFQVLNKSLLRPQ
jgi:hypothetical protein